MCCSSFVVSKGRVRARPKQMYQILYDYMFRGVSGRVSSRRNAIVMVGDVLGCVAGACRVQHGGAVF